LANKAKQHTSKAGRLEGAATVNSVGLRFCKRSKQEHELPALLYGQPFLECGHRSVSFTDLVKQFAVGNTAELSGVSKVGRSRTVSLRIVAVAFAEFTVADGALIEVDRANGTEGGIGGRYRIRTPLGFVGDGPRLVLDDRICDCGGHDHE